MSRRRLLGLGCRKLGPRRLACIKEDALVHRLHHRLGVANVRAVDGIALLLGRMHEGRLSCGQRELRESVGHASGTRRHRGSRLQPTQPLTSMTKPQAQRTSRTSLYESSTECTVGSSS